MKIRRVGAYGVCRDGSGRVLLARNSGLSSFPGQWTLPGGGVDQGEHPDDAVVREFGEETGLVVRIDGLREVLSDTARLPGGDLEHTDRLIYDVALPEAGIALRAEIGGTTEAVEWIEPGRLGSLPLMPFTARVLLPAYDPAPPEISDEPVLRPEKVQRFGAYAVATDPRGRILLSRIAPGYPGAGRWHLPGGGTDHGESPEEALHRELAEETGQHGQVTGLLGVSHRYDPSASGPEGVPVDWHVIRILFRVAVDLPTEPVVGEAGGSTAAAAWFTPEEARAVELTEPAREAVAGMLADTTR